MGDHQRADRSVSMQGLYRPEDEHDACGIGFVADIKGRKSHDILTRGLEVLERMEHRGAESADNKTGDGAGVLLQIPHSFYAALAPALPQAGEYGTGLVFLPSKASGGSPDAVQAEIEKIAAASGLSVVAWREVPTDPSVIGPIARKAEPAVKQVFLAAKGAKAAAAAKTAAASLADGGVPAVEKRLFIFRKRLEKAIREGSFAGKGDFHLPSLSSRTIVYKGMLMSSQLRSYFTELSDPRLETAVALVHSRFSTNTFPSWPLAQPFRMVAHNGEINTVRGNRFWMAATASA